MAKTLNVSTTELIGNVQKKTLKKNTDDFESLEDIDPRPLGHIRQILKLNPSNRFFVYKMADLLLKEQEEFETKETTEQKITS